MKMQNPHYLIHTEMNDATRSAYARLKRKGAFGMTFDGLANLYAATLDYIGERELKEGTSAEEIAADLLAIMINEKSLPDLLRDDNVDTKQISAAVVGEVNAAWQDIGRATRAASNAMQGALTNADGLDDFEKNIDIMLAELKKITLEAYSSLHVIEAQDDAQPEEKTGRKKTAPEAIRDAACFYGDKRDIVALDILKELEHSTTSNEEAAILAAAREIIERNADTFAAGIVRTKFAEAGGGNLYDALTDIYNANITTANVIKSIMDIVKQDEAARNGEDRAEHDDAAGSDTHEKAAKIITDTLELVIDFPRNATSGVLEELSKDAPNEESRAAIDAAQLIIDGDDDGDPADTIRENLCAIVGYATNGKTDEMLDDVLAEQAKNAPNAETKAVIEAVRDILKDSRND